MGNMFSNFKTENDGVEAAGDRLGGGGPLDTGIYSGKVKLAFTGESQYGAKFVEVHLDLGGRQYKERFYVSNREGSNTYQDKKDPKKEHFLPGFVSVNDLCLVGTGYGLVDQDIEEKTFNLWDYDSQSEKPQEVPCLVNLHGQEVTVAIECQTVSKRKKNDQGVYVDTEETRDQNEVQKFFHFESGRTVTEIRNGIEEGVFLEKWRQKNEGKEPRNRVNKNAQAGAKAGRPGGASAGGASKPASSLFGG